jgi:hypothetical protein
MTRSPALATPPPIPARGGPVTDRSFLHRGLLCLLVCSGAVLTGLRAPGVLAFSPPQVNGSETDGDARLAPLDPTPSLERLNQRARQLLSDRCFLCHGPDAGTRATDVRFDLPEGLTSLTDSGQPVVAAGLPEESEMWRRITADDPDQRMPPPDSNLELSPAETELLHDWIARGGKLPSWPWSFIPPDTNLMPPPVEDPEQWLRGPLDHFVLADLQRRGLRPQPTENRTTLLRRLSLLLLGRPPSLTEQQHFLPDDSPDAYERLVDRLLASPEFGESFSQSWLDLARYADTHGYQADRYRAVWPYRDWVIKAFNHDLPFDDFITWQLAGDLLPEATPEQRLATAFQRLHRQTEEGGSTEEEFRVEYVVDRVDTLGTAMLGLTIQCSRCHDHKYDPISQREYYQLAALLDNIDESGLTSHFTDAMPGPTLILPTDGQRQRLAAAAMATAQAEAELATYRGSTEQQQALEQWLAQQPSLPTAPTPSDSFRFGELEQGQLENEQTGRPTARIEDRVTVQTLADRPAAVLSGDSGLVFPEVGQFSRSDPFSLVLDVWLPETLERAVILHRSRAWTDAASRGYELLIEDGQLSFGLIHFWPSNALRVRTAHRLPTQQWLQLAVTYDGSSRAEGVRLSLDGEPLEVVVDRDQLFKTINYNFNVDLTIGSRFRDRGLRQGGVSRLQIFDRQLPQLALRQLARTAISTGPSDLAQPAWTDGERQERLAESRAELLEYFDLLLDRHSQQLREQLRQRRAEAEGAIDPIAEIMVMQEMPQPRPTYLLERGHYAARGELVTGAAPAALSGGQSLPLRDRRELAEWLTAEQHPLTARVAVNRWWQELFGTGLVATSEDFGSQGQMPSHPDLLDYLATRLQQLRWSRKAWLREVLLSATFQQRSQVDSSSRELDPTGEWLSRYPAHRLSAERYRDAALAACGLLARQVGGPPVYPYEPPGLWEEKSGAKYPQGTGQDLYRRSLYSFWKRTSPSPAMTIFDAAQREVCTARRELTLTPLQALVLMNDPQFVEPANWLGVQLNRQENLSLEQQIELACQLCWGRTPTEPQRERLLAQWHSSLRYFQEHPEQAAELLGLGELGWSRQQPISPAAAAMATIVSIILNSDAFGSLR